MQNLPAKLLIAALIFLAICTQGQTVVKLQTDGTYQTEHKERAKTEAIATGEYFKTSEGEKLPIMKSKNGKLFCVRTSKKTGAKYNFYISKN